jgi:hypothetical protein
LNAGLDRALEFAGALHREDGEIALAGFGHDDAEVGMPQEAGEDDTLGVGRQATMVGVGAIHVDDLRMIPEGFADIGGPRPDHDEGAPMGE